MPYTTQVNESKICVSQVLPLFDRRTALAFSPSLPSSYPLPTSVRTPSLSLNSDLKSSSLSTQSSFLASRADPALLITTPSSSADDPFLNIIADPALDRDL
jgi:hypothetical protein